MDNINREISWIQFNGRVLQEALDLNNPLIERIKFLGIFSNNRDEFFRVRVATLRRLIKLEPNSSLQRVRLNKDLEDLLSRVEAQEKEFTLAFNSIIKEFKTRNIIMLNEKQLTESQGIFVNEYFKTVVRPKLFPIILDFFKAGQSLIDSAIYLAVELVDSKASKKARHILIEVPSELPRFLQVKSDNDKSYFMFLDDVIRYNLHDLFASFGYDTIDGFIIKFTRDSELDIDNDVSKSFLEIMELSVKKRTKGIPVRFVYDKNIPQELLDMIIRKLDITTKNYQLRGGGRYHNFKDLIGFPTLKKELMFETLPPIQHPDLSEKTSIFRQLRQQDVMLNYPYHSFQHIVDFLREASMDPKVRSIKMTFYRAAKDSLAMNALINAARNGKSVTVFMELQARFDEQANIMWTQKLQSEGVKVLPTIPGMKVHAKMILVRRKEAGKNIFYSNVSTGNFNESTAKVYSDYSLLTANQEIGRDLFHFFELLESRYRPPQFHLLQVSPFHIREFFAKKMKNEAENKKQGKEAWVILKMNSIVDDEISNLIYETAKAGVNITLNIRGINILKTGLHGFSDHINAFSIVGRFLEHARLFVFANAGKPEFYISSADLMTRNLDHRFELLIPIVDPKIQKQLLDIMHLQMNDTEKYRSLNHNEINEYTRRNVGFPVLDSQVEIYNYYKKQ
jgi:polyphosphate kinase